MAWGPRLPLAPRAGPAPPCSSDSLTSPTLTLPVLRSGRRAPVLEQTPPPSWRLGPLWALVHLASPRRRVVGSQRPRCGELGGQLRCRGARRQGPGSLVWGQGQRRGRTRAALPRVRWRGLSSCPWAPWAWGAGPAPQSAAGAARGTPGQTPGAKLAKPSREILPPSSEGRCCPQANPRWGGGEVDLCKVTHLRDKALSLAPGPSEVGLRSARGAADGRVTRMPGS